ncbi:MAG: radical SAM protein [Elusimicrobiota bacterium]
MSKSIVLVQPMHGSWDKIFLRLPESMLAVAALPHKEGYDVKILDQRVVRDWKGRLRELLKERPICCGLTSLTGPSLKYALEAAALIKEIDESIPIVFGGVHMTLLPEQTMQHPHFDIGLIGEGDYRFLDVVKALEMGKPFDGIKGLYYRLKGELVFTGAPDAIHDLDALPDTPYELVDMGAYSAIELGPKRSVSFPTSRGCPFACSFCANKALTKSRWRGLSTAKIIAKIKMFQERYGYRAFYFLDDCTSYRIGHFRELITALAGLEKKILWSTAGIRADLLCQLTDQDLAALWESGCRTLEIGIESGNERVLEFIQKRETKETMRTANRMLAKYPITVKYTFIVGYPTETEAERNDSIDFSLKLGEENAHSYSLFFVYLPIMGTPMFDVALQHGFVKPRSIEEWTEMDYRSLWAFAHPNWIGHRERKRLETIMLASLFCNRNAKVKLTTPFSKLTFMLYHPVAKLRFKHKFFSFPLEAHLASKLFG